MGSNTAFDFYNPSAEVVSHFWVCSYPTLKTSLVVLRSPLVSSSETSRLFVYDPDGSLINEAGFGFPEQQAGVLELEGLLESCKLEGGMKHAHLEVRSPAGTQHVCRMHTGEGAFIQGEPALVSSRKGTFVPVLFAPNHSAMLVFVNHGRSDATLRCRLFCGRRTPESNHLVPALGCRVLSVPAHFSEFSAKEGQGSLQGYFRITTGSDSNCGVQLIESVLVKENEAGIFGSIG